VLKNQASAVEIKKERQICIGLSTELNPDPAFKVNIDPYPAFEVNTDLDPDPGSFMINIQQECLS